MAAHRGHRRQDDEGYLFLTGRLSDTINRGGEKFGPLEVEEVLRDLPGVVDAGVVGVPDADLGQRVGAVVVADRSVTVEGVVRHSAARLATFKVPEFVVLADELPDHRLRQARPDGPPRTAGRHPGTGPPVRPTLTGRRAPCGGRMCPDIRRHGATTVGERLWQTTF